MHRSSGRDRAQTGGRVVTPPHRGGRVVTPPHRKFKKNAPDWYVEIHEQRRKAHSSRRTRVEHGIAHLKNWRALARHHGRRQHMSDMIQAVAALLSHQQAVTLVTDEQA